MLLLCDVPGFSHILIHRGNTQEDTSGCILVGNQHMIQDGSYKIYESDKAYRAVYREVSTAILDGQDVTIEVKDE